MEKLSSVLNANVGESFKKMVIQVTYSKPQQLPTLYFIGLKINLFPCQCESGNFPSQYIYQEYATFVKEDFSESGSLFSPIRMLFFIGCC